MNRNPLDPGLARPANVPPWYIDQYKRIREIFSHNARVTTEIQMPPVVRLTRNGSDQSLTAGNVETVQWTTAEFDSHSYFDSTNYRWTVKRAGYYHANFGVSFDSTTLAAGFVTSRLRKNGTEVAGSNSKTDGTQFPATPLMVSDIIYLTIDDYIDCAVKSPAASTSPKLQGATNRTWLSIHYIGAKYQA